MTKIRRVNAERPEAEIIAEAARIIKQGGVVCFPTRNLYGLGADAFNTDAVARIFKIKQRSQDKPILILVKTKADVVKLVRNISPAASRIMDRFSPGRVTLVFEANDTLPGNLTAGTGKIGIRVPGHPVAFALVKKAGFPITGTSANLSGAAGCSRIQDLPDLILNQVDLILDAGPLKEGIGSTVVDVTVHPPKILREGGVSAAEILSSL